MAAEAAIRDTGKLPDKTQLNRLVSICGEAICGEEITSYLRYQASRRNPPWPRAFAETVIERIRGPLDTLSGALPEAERDRARVAAWRVYAVFLARAYTYASAVGDSQKGQDRDRARR
ncbi:MAG TPA: hypothetical protein VHW23_03960 [Kofleriaceae bacterium]|nr:hypothetical protein [Kofleriaceae bacterium]